MFVFLKLLQFSLNIFFFKRFLRLVSHIQFTCPLFMWLHQIMAYIIAIHLKDIPFVWVN